VSGDLARRRLCLSSIARSEKSVDRYTIEESVLKIGVFEIQAHAAEVYHGLQAAYRQTLVAPQDDMWAAFSDAANHYALLVDGESVGCCSINEDREILFFHVHAQFENVAVALFDYLINRLKLVAAVPSTVDPSFLSLSLDAGHGAVSKAIMFQHILEPEGTALSGLRHALEADHAAATAFVEAATGMPMAFLDPYLAERIKKGQLFLHEEGDEILASGECRSDERQSGYAHLGIIVGRSERGKGLGSLLMHTLVVECRRQNLKPLCSTEPENIAALSVIHKAGFRARHRVFRVSLEQGA